VLKTHRHTYTTSGGSALERSSGGVRSRIPPVRVVSSDTRYTETPKCMAMGNYATTGLMVGEVGAISTLGSPFPAWGSGGGVLVGLGVLCRV